MIGNLFRQKMTRGQRLAADIGRVLAPDLHHVVQPPDGAAFTVHLSVYRLGARQLVLVRTSSVQAKEGDPAVEASYTADCGPVGEG